MNRFKKPFHNIGPAHMSGKATRWSNKDVATVYDANGIRFMQVIGLPVRSRNDAICLARTVCDILNGSEASPSLGQSFERMLEERDAEIRRLLNALGNIEERLGYMFASPDGKCYPPMVEDIRRVARIALGKEEEKHD